MENKETNRQVFNRVIEILDMGDIKGPEKLVEYFKEEPTRVAGVLGMIDILTIAVKTTSKLAELMPDNKIDIA